MLAVPGIGPETADDILLYAFNRPIFVIDGYTRRLFGRLGLAGLSPARLRPLRRRCAGLPFARLGSGRLGGARLSLGGFRSPRLRLATLAEGLPGDRGPVAFADAALDLRRASLPRCGSRHDVKLPIYMDHHATTPLHPEALKVFAVVVGVAVDPLGVVGENVFPHEFLLRGYLKKAPATRLENQGVPVG